VQVVKRARTTTDDYLHDLLRKSENRALEAEGQTRHYSQRVRTLKWQKFQDKQSDGGLAQKYDSLTALVSCIRQEKKQVEERLHGTFTHVSSLEEKAARAEQSHAAELSDVITNLELSKTVRLLKIMYVMHCARSLGNVSWEGCVNHGMPRTESRMLHINTCDP